MRLSYTITLLLFVFVSKLCAQDSTTVNTNGVPVTQQVDATGVGATEDDAYKAAVLDAVRQVVGTLVTSDTVVKDDRVIKDQILTLSNGFVDQVLKQAKAQQPDGAWQVNLTCIVRKGQVWGSLQQFKVPTKFDGASLFADSISQNSFNQDAHAIMAQAVRNFFRDLPTIFTFTTNKPEIITAENAMTRMKITYHFMVDKNAYYKKLLPPLIDALSKSAKHVFPFNSSGHDASLESKTHEYTFNHDGVVPIVVYDGSKYNLFVFPEDVVKDCNLNKAYSDLLGFIQASQVFVLFYGRESADPILVCNQKQNYCNYLYRDYLYDPSDILKVGVSDVTIDVPTNLLPSIVKVKMCIGLEVRFHVLGHDPNMVGFLDPKSQEPFTDDGWYVHSPRWDYRSERDINIQRGLTGINVGVEQVFYVPNQIVEDKQ